MKRCTPIDFAQKGVQTTTVKQDVPVEKLLPECITNPIWHIHQEWYGFFFKLSFINFITKYFLVNYVYTIYICPETKQERPGGIMNYQINGIILRQTSIFLP